MYNNFSTPIFRFHWLTFLSLAISQFLHNVKYYNKNCKKDAVLSNHAEIMTRITIYLFKNVMHI